MFFTLLRVCNMGTGITINLPADGCALNFFVTGDDGRFHCVLFQLVSV
jgi:hypothetical protein